MIKKKNVVVAIIFFQNVFFSSTKAFIDVSKLNADAESIIAAINKQTKLDHRDVIRSTLILDNIRLIGEKAAEFPELIKPFESLLNVLYEIAKENKKPLTKRDALRMHNELSRFRFRIISPARSKSDTTLLFSTDDDAHEKNSKAPSSLDTTSNLETLAFVNLLDEVCNDLLIMTEPAHIKPTTFRDFVEEHTVVTACALIGGIALCSGLGIALYRHYDSKESNKKLTKIADTHGDCVYLPENRFEKVMLHLSTSVDTLDKSIINKETRHIHIKKFLEHFTKNWQVKGESRNAPLTLLEQLREMEQQNPTDFNTYFKKS